MQQKQYAHLIIPLDSLPGGPRFAGPLGWTGGIPPQSVLLTKVETGMTPKLSSITEAAKFLGVSPARLWYYFNNKSVAPINGYQMSKVTNDL
jgi:hypothetical protein